MPRSHSLQRPFAVDTLAMLRSSPLLQKTSSVAAELQAALGREAALRREMGDLARRRVMQAREFEHRLINGLQMISSLLSLQSRKAKTSEATGQLAIAAGRVAALGRVHRQLHMLDHEDWVEFRRYLKHLCDDLARLLCEESGDCAILVEGTDAEIPAAVAIPLGFIVNELVTNAAKYAKGNITVRFETTAPGCYLLSVLDDGPGVPVHFDPGASKGLGMKIIQGLVKQIDGELHILPALEGRPARFTVAFRSPAWESAPHKTTVVGALHGYQRCPI